MRTKNRKVPKIKTLVESLPQLIKRDEIEFCKIWAESLHNTCIDSGVWNTIYVEIPKRSDIWQDWNTDDKGKTRKVWADCSSISFENTGSIPKIELEFLEVDYNESTNKFTWVDEDLRGHPAAIFRCDIDKLFSSDSAEIDPEDPILKVHFGQDLRQALEDCAKEKYRLYKQANNRTTTLGKTSATLQGLSREEILLAKDWFLKNIDSIEFLIPSGSPTCVPNYREFFDDKYNVEKWDFDELISKIEEYFEKCQQAFFNLYKLDRKPDLDKKGRETIGTNVSIKWRRPETDEVKKVSRRKYENKLEHYLEQWYNSCTITFKTSLDSAPAVVQSLISKLKGTDQILSKNAISSLSIAALIIINLFDGNLNFLDDEAAEIDPLNIDFPDVA